MTLRAVCDRVNSRAERPVQAAGRGQPPNKPTSENQRKRGTPSTDKAEDLEVTLAGATANAGSSSGVAAVSEPTVTPSTCQL